MSTTSSSVVPKIIVVVGTTGVGKTKLGVDLAHHFSGEVINADVMQMYKGLQVATAKVTEEERQGVPHHLMSFLEPHETFSPHEFRKLADEKIQEISARGNLPIVVGGTMYYVQGLLWDHLIGHGGHNGNEAGGGGGSGGGGGDSSSNNSNSNSNSNDGTTTITSLWNELHQVDPEMASELHPNNVRKIARSLEIYRTSGGVTHTELLRRQKEQGGGLSNLTDISNSRYPEACVLWCRCDRDVLKQRLDTRVLTMMSNGLREEIVALQDTAMNEHRSVCSSATSTTTSTSNPAPYDTTRGVYQSIGFKEFEEYLRLIRSTQDQGHQNNRTSKSNQNNDAPAPPPQHEGEHRPNTAATTEFPEALQRGVELLQMSTKRYARKQLSWIRNRWIGNNVPVHVLDTTIVERWEENVNRVAQSIVRATLEGTAQRHTQGDDGGSVEDAQRSSDRSIKWAALNESKRIQKEHAQAQKKNQESHLKKRKYHERKREANRQRKKEWMEKNQTKEEARD